MITQIQVDGYKCLKGPIKLDTNRLNVLVGANASGKSSFLQMLLLLRQSANKDGTITNLHLSGPLYEAGTAQDALHPEAMHQIQIGLLSATESSIFLFQYDRDNDTNSSSRILSTASSSSVPRQIYEKNLIFSYLNAERIGPRVTYPLPPDEIPLSGAVGKHGEYTAAILARSRDQGAVDGWVPAPPGFSPNVKNFVDILIDGPKNIDNIDLREAIKNSGGRLDLLSNILLGWIIPGAVFSANEYPQSDTAAVRFIRDPMNTKSEVRSTHVGFGISYALPIIVAALSLKKSGLMLVENPEAHLHPYSQSRIGAFLAMMAASGRQIFLETHSDHVVNGIRLAVKRQIIEPNLVSIDFFRRGPGEDRSKVIQIVLDKNGRLNQWPEGFFDQIENDLSQL